MNRAALQLKFVTSGYKASALMATQIPPLMATSNSPTLSAA